MDLNHHETEAAYDGTECWSSEGIGKHLELDHNYIMSPGDVSLVAFHALLHKRGVEKDQGDRLDRIEALIHDLNEKVDRMLLARKLLAAKGDRTT